MTIKKKIGPVSGRKEAIDVRPGDFSGLWIVLPFFYDGDAPVSHDRSTFYIDRIRRLPRVCIAEMVGDLFHVIRDFVTIFFLLVHGFNPSECFGASLGWGHVSWFWVCIGNMRRAFQFCEKTAGVISPFSPEGSLYSHIDNHFAYAVLKKLPTGEKISTID